MKRELDKFDYFVLSGALVNGIVITVLVTCWLLS